MSTQNNSLISHILGKKAKLTTHNQQDVRSLLQNKDWEKFTRFDTLEKYKNTKNMQDYASLFGFDNPFFKTHEGKAGVKSFIAGKEYINFSHYNYLGLSGHKKVNAAAMLAIEKYGTSTGASRLVAGERPIQQELENALAKLYGVDSALVFVSGHATNVSTISTLFGSKDLIIHDSLIHNSILEGIRLSGATRRSFIHNDLQALEELLVQMRSSYERVLIVVEGLYSMDGDTINLPHLITIKKRYQTLLMVDEAHSLGVLGTNGYGTFEHCNVDSKDIDIWMGTLSKTLSSCGGYIAGSSALIDILKYHAPGFVYSVGISPPLAAASLKALEIMQEEPARVEKLRHNAMFFLKLAQDYGFNVGSSEGFVVIPLIVGNSRKAVVASNKLFSRGINVQPIIHPAVEDKAARLRFFISAEHSKEDINITLQHCKEICK